MGIFSIFKRDKFKRLKRDDVVGGILALQEKEIELDKEIEQHTSTIDVLTERAKTENDRSMKLLYIKKINSAKAQRDRAAKRQTYLVYNQGLMTQLRDAVDDKDFYKKMGKVKLNDLLTDPVGLRRFLNKTLNIKIVQENALTASEEAFEEIEASYEPNERIYGVNKSDDELLSLFEQESSLKDQALIANIENGTSKQANTNNN